jgi:spore germination cell wall hydrolase CwlJ-like protein
MVGSSDYDKHQCRQASEMYQSTLKTIKLSPQDREAIVRVTYAEAATQGDAGLAGVVYTILNRYISGDFGDTIPKILNAPHQFEPVHKAGGWHNLPKATPEQTVKVNTIINLALSGHLPDLTKGALFFQNPQIVSTREHQKTVSKGLTHFGGSVPSAVIKDHAFYAVINNPKHHSKPKPFYSKPVVQNNISYDIFSQQPKHQTMMVGF